MIREFFKDSAVYSLGILLTRGIQIFMLPVYTRLLHPSDYGVSDLLIIVINFLNVTIALEITQGFARCYPDARTDEEKMLYSSTSFLFVLFAYTAFFIFAIGFSTDLSRIIIGRSYSVSIFQIAMVAAFSSGIFSFLQNQLRIYLKSKSFALTGVLFTVISYPVSIILMMKFNTGVSGIFGGMAAGYFAAGFISWYVARQNYKPAFSWAKFKEMLRLSVPLVPASIGASILLYVDRLAINSLMTKEDLGLFAVSTRFAAILSLVLFGFQSSLTPLIYMNYKNENTPKEISRIFRYFLTIVLGFIGALSIFSIEALKIFTTPAYFGAVKVIPIISFATLFISMQIFTPGLIIAKKTKTIAAVNILSGAMNALLAFILIPVLGLVGASLATLITSAGVFGILMYNSQKLFHVPHNWKRISAAVIFTVFLIAVFVFIADFSSFSLITKNLIKFLFWIISVAILIHILIGFERFRNILKEMRLIALNRFRKRKDSSVNKR